eukprot:TRINITY_DN3954_c0_g7_i1.p1 TRINITY_DN3954_c0_g7~~TRINITY_DN3954_c0_g7_i1.p1  ORF type:complete len:566 (-),score=119.21 TRINITY_DN3954_c0_g7_i1:776-2473(-)
MIPLDTVWKWLWQNFTPLDPHENGGILKEKLVNEFFTLPSLEVGKAKASEVFAKILIQRVLELLFHDQLIASAEEQRNNTSEKVFPIKRLTEEERERRKRTTPPIPEDTRAALLKEVREEILGRKSANNLYSLSQRRMMVGIDRAANLRRLPVNTSLFAAHTRSPNQTLPPLSRSPVNPSNTPETELRHHRYTAMEREYGGAFPPRHMDIQRVDRQSQRHLQPPLRTGFPPNSSLPQPLHIPQSRSPSPSGTQRLSSEHVPTPLSPPGSNHSSVIHDHSAHQVAPLPRLSSPPRSLHSSNGSNSHFSSILCSPSSTPEPSSDTPSIPKSGSSSSVSIFEHSSRSTSSLRRSQSFEAFSPSHILSSSASPPRYSEQPSSSLPSPTHHSSSSVSSSSPSIAPCSSSSFSSATPSVISSSKRKASEGSFPTPSTQAVEIIDSPPQLNNGPQIKKIKKEEHEDKPNNSYSNPTTYSNSTPSSSVLSSKPSASSVLQSTSAPPPSSSTTLTAHHPSTTTTTTTTTSTTSSLSPSPSPSSSSSLSQTTSHQESIATSGPSEGFFFTFLNSS